MNKISYFKMHGIKQMRGYSDIRPCLEVIQEGIQMATHSFIVVYFVLNLHEFSFQPQKLGLMKCK